MLGRVNGKTKATVLASADAIVNPGRIGLVAVDALAAGIPVLTTQYRFHAPEAEYLSEGQTMYSSADDPVSYATLISGHIGSGSPRERLAHPTLDQMVSNFAGGAGLLLA